MDIVVEVAGALVSAVLAFLLYKCKLKADIDRKERKKIEGRMSNFITKEEVKEMISNELIMTKEDVKHLKEYDEHLRSNVKTLGDQIADLVKIILKKD